MIDISSVMVGDWYHHENGRDIRVELPILDSGVESNLGHIKYEYLSPIPLTEDLLLKNGFEALEGMASGVFCKIGSNFRINLYGNTLCFGKGVKLKYVHQLQHALKLCGHIYAADSFQVIFN